MLFRRHMDHHDPAGQIVILDMAEPCLAEQLAEPDLIGKGTDRRRQIFIDTGMIPRHFRSNPGQQTEGIRIIQPAEPRMDGPRKLQADESSPRFQDASNLRAGLHEIADIAHAKSGRHCVKCAVAKS